MTHGQFVLWIGGVQCMPHGSWGCVTMCGPWVMGKKLLNGVVINDDIGRVGFTLLTLLGQDLA